MQNVVMLTGNTYLLTLQLYHWSGCHFCHSKFWKEAGSMYGRPIRKHLQRCFGQYSLLFRQFM